MSWFHVIHPRFIPPRPTYEKTGLTSGVLADVTPTVQITKAAVNCCSRVQEGRYRLLAEYETETRAYLGLRAGVARCDSETRDTAAEEVARGAASTFCAEGSESATTWVSSRFDGVGVGGGRAMLYGGDSRPLSRIHNAVSINCRLKHPVATRACLGEEGGRRRNEG